MAIGVYKRTKPAWNKGMKMSKEWGEERSHSFKGKRHTQQTKDIISVKNKGHIVTEEMRQNMRNNHTGGEGMNGRNWRGGKSIRADGYAYVYAPDHPTCKPDNHMLEHRYVMENHLGRSLEKHEVVHHINGVKTDNHVDNLLVTTVGEHKRLHDSTFMIVMRLYELGIVEFEDGNYVLNESMP